MNLESLIAVNSQEEIDMNLFLITFIPCGTQFLVDQETEDKAFLSAVEANRTVGEMEDTDLSDRTFYEIKKIDFSELANLIQTSSYWGKTEKAIIFNE